MAYLEKNILFLEEIKRNLALQNLTLQRGKVIAETPNTRFVEIGSYESALRGSQLHLGLKESKNPALMTMKRRIPTELAFMEHLAKRLPFLLPELPACYARLLGKDSSLLGIVMEDFT